MPLRCLRWLAMAALLAILFAWSSAGHAQQSAPLFPPPSADTAAHPEPADAPAAAPSLWRQAAGFVVRAERDFSRQLNRQLGAIRRGDGSTALLGGILAAFLYGVFHTLAVGHGKTVVVGYFLGNHARPAHGVAMAGWIAISHVLGAIVVAVAAHWILERTLLSPIEQNHWIRMISFGAIALIGGWMLAAAWRRLRGTGGHHDHDHDHHHHHHNHDHGFGHGTGHRRLLAVAAGFVPCSGAILILTFAFANGIRASGLAMVAAIAVGMALTLAGLGLVSMAVRHQVAFRLAGRSGGARWLGLLGPLLILVRGGLLFLAELSILVIAPSA
jgi:ABC-type nickel/cobalt efflux system permease component RcnA